MNETQTPDLPMLLTVHETAHLLAVSPTTVRQLCYAGTLPSVKVGKCLRVRRDELVAWVEANTRRAEA